MHRVGFGITTEGNNMRQRHLFTTALATALATAALAVPAGATSGAAQSDTHPRLGTRSLATVLAADGNRFDRKWGDFDILDRTVRTVLNAKPSSPVAVLADGRTRLTAFLPTDRAFRRLVVDLTGTRPATERATFTAAATLGVDTLETVLLFHVVPGDTITAREAAHADGVKLVTAEGGDIQIDVRRDGIFVRDDDFDDPNPRVLPWLTDINKGNRQIAHGISRVLRPSNL